MRWTLNFFQGAPKGAGNPKKDLAWQMQMASSPWHTENPLCSSERDAVRDEEENDMLLYMWQKAAFMDSGQGIPREMADSLRLRIAQLSSYHTKLYGSQLFEH